MLKYFNYDIVFQEIPNEVTLAINITNCPNHCKGCHSTHLQEDIGEELNEERISSLMDKYGSSITCFCFMGGDSDSKRVEELALYIQHIYPNIKTGWYSGRTEVPENIDNKSFQFIKLGPYIEKFGSLKSETCNQHLYEVLPSGEMKDISYFFRK